MQGKNILISGAGVAGPSLAYWLARAGHSPTIVERAASVRDGGQAVDFRGDAHMRVLDEMGILDGIRRKEARGGPVSFVDAEGNPLATMSSEVASGDVEILRGDLGRILFDATKDTTEYIFGDSIRAIDQASGDVYVEFDRSQSRRFDLVVGADGLHSAVRRLVFGPESNFLHHCGYYVAISSAANTFGSEPRGLLYNVPGRAVGVFTGSGAARTIFYVASPALSCDRHDTAEQKEIVARACRDMGWHTPRLIHEMRDAHDFYFDAIGEIRIPVVSKGRVALLGDAAFGGTLGGMGTGAAVVGAYVLASELGSAGGDHAVAFRRYEQRIRGYATRCQSGARTVGSFMAPRTRYGIWLRNQMLNAMNRLPGKGLMERIAMSRASDIDLSGYAVAAPALLPC